MGAVFAFPLLVWFVAWLVAIACGEEEPGITGLIFGVLALGLEIVVGLVALVVFLAWGAGA